MRRRDFITLIGGAAASWPLAAHAQDRPIPIVGFLSSNQPQAFAQMIDAFRLGLRDVGYTEGKNVVFEHRAAGNSYERYRALADDLVHRQVAVIFANGGTTAALAAKAATTTVPVVFFVSSDPVAQGLVESFNRPGGNLTGLSFLSVELAAKRLELLVELVPRSINIAVIWNPKNVDGEIEVRGIQQAARKLGRRIFVISAGSEDDLDTAFATLASQKIDALMVASDAFYSGQRSRIVELAARHAVPAIYDRREFPDAGGLIAYGHHRADSYRQLGTYVGRILNGTRPNELPVLQPTKFEFVINLKTAKALGITVPLTLQVAADEVIE